MNIDKAARSTALHQIEQLEHCKEVEADVSKKTVLVTGVAGFIGSHCAQKLLDRGDSVIGVDEINDYYDIEIKNSNITELEKRENFYFSKGNISDFAFMNALFEKHKPQWILHMAARAGVQPSIQEPLTYIQSNIQGTTMLLELIRIHGTRHFVFASSSSVYGGSTKLLFSESDDVSNPISPYAATKKSCELLAYTYNHLHNISVTGLRFFTVYGPRCRPDMAPFKFIDSVFKNSQIIQYGDGRSARDYTYIDDIVDGCLRALDRPCGYQIYNLGCGKPIVLRDFISIIEQNVGKYANVQIAGERPGDVPYTCANITKAKYMLGYNPKTPFAEGIRVTIAWYRTHYIGKIN